MAEVIASRIDAELQRQVSRPLRGTRYIDDYHLYFDTLAEAETALSGLHRVAAGYELEVNDAKTAIIELPEPLEPSWKTQWRAIRIDDGNDPTSIKALFDRGFELAKQFPHDSVLTYVAKKIQGVSSLKGKNWEVCEPLLLRACFGEPTMLPLLLDIYDQHNDGAHERLRALIELCVYHGLLHQGFEVAWSLWLAKNMALRLSDPVGEIVRRIDDDIVVLAALDLRGSSLPKIDDVSLWGSHLTRDDLYSEHWLLAYEACSHNWLTPPGEDDIIASDNFFSILHRHDVSFYDTGTEWADGYHETGYLDDDAEENDEDLDEAPFWEIADLRRPAILHFTPPLHRLPDRDFIGELDVAAHRNAHGDARHLHPQRLQQLR